MSYVMVRRAGQADGAEGTWDVNRITPRESAASP